MNIKQLFCNPEGKLSHGKLWSNIAFTIASYVVIKLANNNSSMLSEVFLIYLVVVSGSEVGKKYLTMKLGGKSEPSNPQ